MLGRAKGSVAMDLSITMPGVFPFLWCSADQRVCGVGCMLRIGECTTDRMRGERDGRGEVRPQQAAMPQGLL